MRDELLSTSPFQSLIELRRQFSRQVKLLNLGDNKGNITASVCPSPELQLGDRWFFVTSRGAKPYTLRSTLSLHCLHGSLFPEFLESMKNGFGLILQRMGKFLLKSIIPLLIQNYTGVTLSCLVLLISAGNQKLQGSLLPAVMCHI